MPQHALELTLDAGSDHWVRSQWAALADRGLPSQAGHRGATNAPHVTVVAADALPEPTIGTAVAALSGVLPCPLPIAGLAVFGTRRLTVALLATPPPGLGHAVDAIRSTVPATGGRADQGWVCHVTLARGLAPDQLAQAVALLGGSHPVPTLTAAALRRWDPAAGTVTALIP